MSFARSCPSCWSPSRSISRSSRTWTIIDRARRLSPFLFGLIVVPLIGFYDGIFGPGTGSFFMLAFVALAGYGLLKATAHTKLLNFASNLGAFAVFAFVGVISWKIGLMMGAAQFAGAQTGLAPGHEERRRIIKPLLVITCVALAVKLISDPAKSGSGLVRASDRSENRQKNRARGNQGNAEPVHHREMFAQKQHAEDRHQHDRQLVERRHPRGISELESTEIGKPGCTGGQPRKPRNTQVLKREWSADARHFPIAVRMAPRTTMITQVRMKVARSLSMSLMPTLAKIAVSAANTAATRAQNCQLAVRLIPALACRTPRRSAPSRRTGTDA
jgi:hypothetical protein